MKRYVAVSLFLLAGLAWADDADRVTVPFSDPSRPKTVNVHLLNGGITVKGNAGKDVIVEARSRSSSGRHRVPERAEGMHRIDATGTGLTVEEADNVVEVKTRDWSGAVDVTVQVPFNTSVKLKTVNDGDIVADHVNGDMEVDDINGKVTLTNISGSAVVHALNGRIAVTFDRITQGKAMSFSSLNGDIDVTFPSDLRANVKVKTDNGEAYSDFEIKIDPSGRKPIVEEGDSEHGRHHVRFERGTWGTINGGGPDMQFTTMNGNIYIRKTK